MTVMVSAPATRPLTSMKRSLPGAGDAALDVVAELLELAVDGLEAELALDLHDDRARPRGRGLGVDRMRRGRQRPPGHRARAAQPARPARRRARPAAAARSGASSVELLHPLLQPRLQVVGALAGLAELSRALALPACSWSLSCSARWSQ